MRRSVFILLLVHASVTIAGAQNPMADSLMLHFAKAQGDAARIGLMNKIIYEVPTLTQEQRITYTKAILDRSRKSGDKVMESVTTAELGYLLAYNGNRLQGTELAYAALEMAQHHDNAQALGIIYNDLATCMEDSSKVFEYLRAGLAASERAGDAYNGTSALLNLAHMFKDMGMRDSALYYAQRGYERSLKVGSNSWFPTGGLWLLAMIHEDLYGDRVIAREYVKKAMTVPGAMEHPDAYTRIYITLSRFQLADGRADSALYYADLLKSRREMFSPYMAVNLYDLYKRIYDTTNADSALKYYRLAETANAELEATQNRQGTALLQMKVEMEIDQQTAEREQNLQLAFIAIGILSFVSIFLLLSRTIIITPRVVSFLSVITLLIVFEFLNLLLHPFLVRITHHSPVLMLLALVCIAALLVPLHHRLEKWATAKLVEKNKAIRLAEAKRTIEKLEGKDGTPA